MLRMYWDVGEMLQQSQDTCTQYAGHNTVL